MQTGVKNGVNLRLIDGDVPANAADDGATSGESNAKRARKPQEESACCVVM